MEKVEARATFLAEIFSLGVLPDLMKTWVIVYHEQNHVAKKKKFFLAGVLGCLGWGGRQNLYS